MAFSQVQCLDDNHVNWRSSESKPEFFYSEEQRLALEALVARGRDAFYEVLKRENIRDFLSELELARIVETIEVYDPGSEDLRGSGRRPELQENGGVDASEDASAAGGPPATAEPLPSLEYWPQKSDRSIPQLDLGWPDTIAYRGVTRASVYMQPPIDGQPHIKEVVRKMISQAQKVIAVVMDMFTDVDIFKDLLDAGFKRKVAVYIIVDESNVKYFLHMCERARMHLGHLKGQQFHQHGGTTSRTPGPPRYRPAADGTQSSPKKASPATAGPHHWQPKGGPAPRMLPGPGSPRPTRNTRLRAELRATEEHPSPFGIPYSKLSQSKHLKARAGGSQWVPSDSKRRARDHKEP